MARNCHRRTTPASGEPDKLYYRTCIFFNLLPFYTVVAPLYIRLSQPRASFLVLLPMTGFICISLNIVVFVARNGCNNNRRDSDVSLFDKFYISPRHVSYSPIPSLIFSTLTIIKVFEPDQSHPTYKILCLSACYRALVIPQSYICPPVDWKYRCIDTIMRSLRRLARMTI